MASYDYRRSEYRRDDDRKSHRLRNWLIGIGIAIVALIGGLVGCAALVGSALNQAANPDAASSQAPAAGAPANSGSGGGGGGAVPAGPLTLALGTPAAVSQDGAKAATVTLDRRVIASQAVDQFSQGPQNGYFVAIHVSVQGASSLASGFDISSADFYALDGSAHFDEGDGNAFEGPHSGGQIDFITLNAGETASGWLLFDLPSAHGKIVYAPNLDSQPIAYWKF